MVVSNELLAFLEPNINITEVPNDSLPSSWIRPHQSHLVLAIYVVELIELKRDFIIVLGNSIDSQLIDWVVVCLMQ